jgi:hypothetical protein
VDALAVVTTAGQAFPEPPILQNRSKRQGRDHQGRRDECPHSAGPERAAQAKDRAAGVAGRAHAGAGSVRDRQTASERTIRYEAKSGTALRGIWLSFKADLAGA